METNTAPEVDETVDRCPLCKEEYEKHEKNEKCKKCKVKHCYWCLESCIECDRPFCSDCAEKELFDEECKRCKTTRELRDEIEEDRRERFA